MRVQPLEKLYNLFCLHCSKSPLKLAFKSRLQYTLKPLWKIVFISQKYVILQITVAFSGILSEEGKRFDGKSDQNRRCEFWVINYIVLFIEEQIDGYASTPLENISMDSINQSF